MRMLSYLLRTTAVFGFLAFASGAGAQECQPVRLDLPGRSAAKLPIRDIGVNLCQYAVALDIIEAQLEKIGKPHPQFSEIDLAASVTAAKGLNSLAANVQGNEILDAARAHPLCSVSHVSKLVRRDDFVLCSDAARFASILTGDSNFKHSGKSCGAILRDSTDWDDRILREGFDQQDVSPYALKKAIEKVCPTHSRTTLSNLPEAEKLSGSSFGANDRSSSLRQKIDDLLDRPGALPVGLRYCADVLLDVHALGVDAISGKTGMKICKNWHASSIIGRRQGSTSCEYLVKVNWGAGCKIYDNSLQCENGKIWLPHRELISNTTGLFWLN